MSTTPSLELISPVERSTANVVPRLVEHKAAPAAKDWRGVASLSFWSTNESPTGALMPVRAMHEDRKRLALSALKEVESPPNWISQLQIIELFIAWGDPHLGIPKAAVPDTLAGRLSLQPLCSTISPREFPKQLL